MPGPFGALTRGERLYSSPVPFEATTPFHQSSTFLVDKECCQLGLVERTTSRSWVSTHGLADGTLAIVYGHCYDSRSRVQLDAASLLTMLGVEGDQLWDRTEGAFLVVLYDPRRGRLQLINDCLAILPTYWHADPGRFCFAPALRYLPVDLYRGKPDPTSVLHFLSIGKYPGTRTPIAGVSLLGPASRLTVDLALLVVSHVHYWTLAYRTEPGTSSAELVRDLGEAIEESTDLLTRPGTGRGGLFLSGGWDSRSLLGASLAMGRPPARVITNGVSDDIDGSDTWLARRLALFHNLDYFFSRRAPVAGAESWLEGLRLCEVATENSPGNFGIHRLPSGQFNGLDYMLKGDVTWGSGDLATAEDEVISRNFPWPLEANVRSVVAAPLRADAPGLYAAAIESELARCPNDHPADRQQWLWQMSGINRYIFGLGYFDEEFIQVRRPLLTRIVLDQWVRVPRRYRIHKNLFLESIHQRYPQLFRLGRNHVSNIADYYAQMAPFVRNRALTCLQDGCDLWGLLDRDECVRRIGAFQPALFPRHQPDLKTRVYNRIHDSYAWRWHRSPWYRESRVQRLHTADDSLAFRLYLLIEWFHHQRDHCASSRP